MCVLSMSRDLSDTFSIRGNRRSLMVRVGENAVRVYRLTKTYGMKRYYRCSTCKTINKTASEKKRPKLITICGSINSSHDPEHHTAASRWLCSNFVLEKSISFAAERFAKASVSLVKHGFGLSFRILGWSEFSSVFKASLIKLFVINEWIFLLIWSNSGSQNRSQWWQTTRYGNTISSLGNRKKILCCEPPTSFGHSLGPLRLIAMLSQHFTRESDEHRRKVILQDRS